MGSRVGRYRLLALLASGGMAHVWAAEPEGSGGISRTVAIKVIRAEFADDLDYARMFIDEATIATAVRHPNVCETFELNREKAVLFMAMEWIAGESLGGLLRAQGGFLPLPHALAVRIAADACAGLHAAHEAVDGDGNPLGVIHRDVSPPNILISLQGQVKVTDFGVAKAKYQLHERTKTGEVKGKFGYLAPEQITGDPCDRRVDVYAMGCVLYVATLGARPFGNGPEAMTKILVGTYQLPSEIDPNYPPGLELIVRRALEQRPADRFESADAMRHALEHWLWEQRMNITQADMARLVRERMAPEALTIISELQRKTKSQSNVAYQMFLQNLQEMEPPTASTRVPSAPPSGPVTVRTQEEDVDDGPTLIATRSSAPALSASPQTPLPSAIETPPVAGDEQSGWHRTGSLSPPAGHNPAATPNGQPVPLRSASSAPPADFIPLPLLIGGLSLIVVLLSWLVLR